MTSRNARAEFIHLVWSKEKHFWYPIQWSNKFSKSVQKSNRITNITQKTAFCVSHYVCLAIFASNPVNLFYVWQWHTAPGKQGGTTDSSKPSAQWSRKIQLNRIMLIQWRIIHYQLFISANLYFFIVAFLHLISLTLILLYAKSNQPPIKPTIKSLKLKGQSM